MPFKQHFIVGSGPVGLFTAALLKKHGKDVTLIVSPDSDLPSPVTIKESLSNSRYFNSKKVETIKAADLNPLPKKSALWLCVKAYSLEAALEQIKPKLSPDTVVIGLSNGLGITDLIRSKLGRPHPILRLLYNFGVMFGKSKNLVVSGKLVANLNGDSNVLTLKEFKKELESLGFYIELHSSVQISEWSKLLVNIVVNSIATLEDSPNGCILERPELKKLAEKVLSETRLVAKSVGVELARKSDRSIFEAIGNHAKNINSTLMDIRLGRPTELPFTLYKVVQIGRKNKLKIPELFRLYARFKTLFNQY